MQSLDLKWPNIVKEFLNKFSVAGNFSEGISFQCNLYDFHIRLEEIYFKTIFLSALPFVILFCSVSFLFMQKLLNKKPRWFRFFVILIVSSIFLQPNIIKVLAENLVCMEINKKLYLKANLDIDCRSSNYLLWYKLLINEFINDLLGSNW